MADADNLFEDLPAKSADEVFERLAGGENVLIERIVSHGQATPEGTWLRQERHEWIVLLRGRAKLELRDGQIGRASCRERVCQYV